MQRGAYWAASCVALALTMSACAHSQEGVSLYRGDGGSALYAEVVGNRVRFRPKNQPSGWVQTEIVEIGPVRCADIASIFVCGIRSGLETSLVGDPDGISIRMSNDRWIIRTDAGAVDGRDCDFTIFSRDGGVEAFGATTCDDTGPLIATWTLSGGKGVFQTTLQ